MAAAFDWFKTCVENIAKPFMENKKAVLMLLGLFIGTGAYTIYDQTGNGLKHVNKEVIEEIPLSNDDSPKVPEEVVPDLPEVIPPTVVHETKIVRETIQPIVNCPPERAVEIMRSHVEEYH